MTMLLQWHIAENTRYAAATANTRCQMTCASKYNHPHGVTSRAPIVATWADRFSRCCWRRFAISRDVH